MTTRVYQVPDISCEHCKHSIEGEVAKLADVSRVEVKVATKTVTVVGSADDADILAAIDEAGYNIAG
jgi:copper chaperone